MKRQVQDTELARAATLQNRLLFWLAAALAPESAPWYLGYTPALLRHSELTRQSAEPVAEPAQLDTPVEAQRRAA